MASMIDDCCLLLISITIRIRFRNIFHGCFVFPCDCGQSATYAFVAFMFMFL